MKLTVSELFAGVGGFRVGLNHIEKFCPITDKTIEEGPWEFVYANQFEPNRATQHAYDCYITRFGEGSCSNEDIHLVDKSSIPEHSLLVGGFPCQDYSVARSKANEQGIEGKKGVLFWDIRDVLLEKRPPFVLLENVDRLLQSPSTQKGRDFAIMLKTFNELDYEVCWRVVNAADYGMPQKRRRVFIFAYHKSTKCAEGLRDVSASTYLNQSLFTRAFPVESSCYKLSEVDLRGLRDVIEVSEKYAEGQFLNFGFTQDGVVYHTKVTSKLEAQCPLEEVVRAGAEYVNNDYSAFMIKDEQVERWRYLKSSKRIDRISKSGHHYVYSEGQIAFPDSLDSPARTMLTSEGTVNRSSHILFEGSLGGFRTLTPVECELIQMFPPNWTNTNGMPDRNRRFLMGNALVTGIISRLEPYLREVVEAE